MQKPSGSHTCPARRGEGDGKAPRERDKSTPAQRSPRCGELDRTRLHRAFVPVLWAGACPRPPPGPPAHPTPCPTGQHQRPECPAEGSSGLVPLFLAALDLGLPVTQDWCVWGGGGAL